MSRAVIRKYVYCAVWSAGLFLLSWISLTVLKIKTTDSQNIVLYKVTED